MDFAWENLFFFFFLAKYRDFNCLQPSVTGFTEMPKVLGRWEASSSNRFWTACLAECRGERKDEDFLHCKVISPVPPPAQAPTCIWLFIVSVVKPVVTAALYFYPCKRASPLRLTRPPKRNRAARRPVCLSVSLSAVSRFISLIKKSTSIALFRNCLNGQECVSECVSVHKYKCFNGITGSSEDDLGCARCCHTH